MNVNNPKYRPIMNVEPKHITEGDITSSGGVQNDQPNSDPMSGQYLDYTSPPFRPSFYTEEEVCYSKFLLTDTEPFGKEQGSACCIE